MRLKKKQQSDRIGNGTQHTHLLADRKHGAAALRQLFLSDKKCSKGNISANGIMLFSEVFICSEQNAENGEWGEQSYEDGTLKILVVLLTHKNGPTRNFTPWNVAQYENANERGGRTLTLKDSCCRASPLLMVYSKTSGRDTDGGGNFIGIITRA
jgi:hypothetical protein